MSGSNSPADRQSIWEEREKMAMVDPAVTTALAQLTADEDNLFLTPEHSPAAYSPAAYSPYSPAAYSPDSAYSSEGNYPTSDPTAVSYYCSTQGMEQSMQTLPVSVAATQYATGPTSPCSHDSPYCTPSPYGTSPMGTPSPYSTSPRGSPVSSTCASHYTSYPCTMPADSTTMHIAPPTSIHVTYSSVTYDDVTKSVYSGYYPPMQSGWEEPLPTYHDSFVPDNLVRTSSHSSIEGEQRIQMIDSAAGTIEYYPPTPESPETRHTCCEITPNGYQHSVIFSGPHHHMQDANGLKQHIRGPQRKMKKPPKPPVQVDDSGIKDIPTSSQLWEFTLRVLKKPKYSYMISWENQKEGLFRFHDAQAYAALWGKHRNRPNMTYDKVARALRYYYKRDILNQVGGRLTYKFSKRLGKLYSPDE